LSTSVGKNIWYASISNIMPSIFTYIFWFVTAKVAGPEAIGLASTIAAFTVIVATVDVVDTSLGMKRHLGIAISSGNIGKFKQILASTIIFVSIIVIISASLIAWPSLRILEIAKIDRQYVWIVIAMIASCAFQYVLSEALIAALQSDRLVMSLLIGSLVRFPLLFGIIYLFNVPAIGTVIAYSSMFFIATAFYSIYLAKILRSPSRAIENIAANTKLVLSAGLASWIPHLISVVGSQLGIITVSALEGSAEGGKFYLPMAIYTLMFFIVWGITRVSHPLIAGMDTKEHQTSFVAYSIKIAFMLTMPIATPFLFFPSTFLNLMGREFGSAGVTLSIFMISLPMGIVTEIVYFFVYGRGDTKTVLYLGLAGNVPRIILYYLMVPIFGPTGGALAYLVGSVTQLVLSVIVGAKHSLVMEYRKYVILTAIPTLIGFVMWLVGINPVVATVIIFFGSMLAYIRLRLFTDTELYNILYSGLSKGTAEKIYPRLSKLIQRIS
jgi:O-antigen/teichoic acid export membrane protein